MKETSTNLTRMNCPLIEFDSDTRLDLDNARAELAPMELLEIGVEEGSG